MSLYSFIPLLVVALGFASPLTPSVEPQPQSPGMPGRTRYAGRGW